MFLVFGTKAATSIVDSGTFFCPSCESEQYYQHKVIQKKGHLYGISVLPMGDAMEYVECQRCEEAYRPGVLSFRPVDPEESFKSDFELALRRLLVMVMMADGQVHDAEIEQITKIFAALTDHRLTRQEVVSEISVVRSSGNSVGDYASALGSILNDEGKELAVKAVLAVAGADGEFHDSEKSALMETTRALGISPAHLRGILVEMRESD